MRQKIRYFIVITLSILLNTKISLHSAETSVELHQNFYVQGDYQTTELPTDMIRRLQTEFQIQEKLIALVLVTSSADQSFYTQQMEILMSLDAENMQLLYITANSSGIDTHSYFVGLEESAQLLGTQQFRVLFFSVQGLEAEANNRVLSAAEITAILRDIRR